jgi:uncharacterized protein YidB (DUF937 family)
MDDLLKDLGGVAGQAGQAAAGQSGQSGNPLGELFGSLGAAGGSGAGGGLGSILGAMGGTSGTGGVPGAGGVNLPAGGLASLGSLLPALLGLLGGASGSNQTGLHQIVGTMQANGLGNVAQSWLGNGASQAITPSQVEQVLSSTQLSELAAKSGLPPDQLKSGIASLLPHLVSGLSPNGSLPEASQVQGAVGELQQIIGGLTGQH